MDKDGNVIVADYEDNRIQKFTPEHQLLVTSSFIEYPTSIAFNATTNNIYVASSIKHVCVLNSDLTFSRKLGDEGQFHCPRGIACDSTGKVYVVDDNHGIQVFTAEGIFSKTFGKELLYPNGVCIDTYNLVYVSEGRYLRTRPGVHERDNHNVSVFTSEGQFVTSFGRRGEGQGEFKCPRGLAVNNKGVIYVCDHYNSRLQVF